ncbi:MAG: sensor histidine kinase [Lachnospiraceae bacterium]|nr:sensor histidine kinase [Lachnospiraceae bacterium]
MIQRLKQQIRFMDLTSKIRWSYLLLTLPILGLVLFAVVSFLELNHRYDAMITSVTKASEFSMDFKKDFDCETYLVLVGNKTPEESDLDEMLLTATGVVQELNQVTVNPENRKILESISKYLKNLETYKARIQENLKSEYKYEENLRIWENDVQIVTTLIRESVIAYIHGESCDLQEARDAYRELYIRILQLLSFLVVVLLAFLILVSYYIPLGITRSLRELCAITDRIAMGDLTVSVETQGGVETRALSNSMNTMIRKINELIDQVTAEQKRLRRSEFELLQSQINPHFLYNTLDAIMWLIETEERAQAVNMIRNLSDFFRTSLNQGKDIVTVEEEMQHVRSYLEIQRTRYQDILEYEIHVPSELNRFTIPKLTIQPLVENALYHGIKNRRGGGRILVTGRLQGEDYVLTVEDNGMGMTGERLEQVREGLLTGSPAEGNMYGLYNVNERIRLNIGEGYGLSLVSTYGEGTCIEVLLKQ